MNTEETPNFRIRAALRMLWLRSRERAAALKRDHYTCQNCKKKQTLAKGKEFKVEVHHINGIDNWAEVIDIIKQKIFCNPDKLITLCKECHKKLEDGTRQLAETNS